MVAIFTGLGAGFERGSGSVLGGAGLLGSASLGRNKEQVLLNAATGNLLINQQDEFLVGVGPDSAIGRTYNSIENVSDGDNGDHWRQSTTRAVHGLTGTLNTTGSTIKRTSGDGSDITYTYQTINGASAYFTTDGSGAYDKLVNASGVWTWTDGDTQSTETYSAYGTDNWRITLAADVIGRTLGFTYTGANLTQVTTQDGSYEQYSWLGGHVTTIVTGYTDLANNTPNQTLTRTRYGYDSYNRLTTVTIDLTPEDNLVDDGATYVTTYTYKSNTSTDPGFNRIWTISETDGPSITIDYDSAGRVMTLTQAVAGSGTRATGITYGTGLTTITDSLGQVTTLDYNSDGSLKKVTSPPAYGTATAQTTQFDYTADGKGNLWKVTDALGAYSTYTYDGSGNILTVTDPLNNVVTRTYGPMNEMLTETRTGSDAGSAGASHTTRYIYIGNLVSAKVDAEGRVTVYQYATINGLLTDRILNEKQYNDAFYDLSTLSSSTAITDAQMTSFLSSMAAKANTVTTNYQYDLRGNVSSIRTTSSANSAGGGDTTQPYAVTNYIYDQAGQLLKRTGTGLNTEIFVYDGMRRITAVTDLNGGTTHFAFNDSAMTTIVTLDSASGLSQTSIYNKAGELVSFTESGNYVTGGTAYYAYDQRGQLRVTTDATGHKSYIVYDKTGRKIADVDHYLNVIEYKYDADDRLVATVRYTNTTSVSLTTLQDATSNIEMSGLRPAASSTDLWAWNVYDADSRVIETIDGAGDVTTYQYDASSRLIGTTRYAKKLTPAQLTTIQTTLPTSFVLPTPDSAHDSIARNFYDKTGLLVGVLDGEGYLSRIVYDNVGRKVTEIAYATISDSNLRAAGTFNALVNSVTTVANPADRTTRYVYDGQSHLRFQIDTLNHVTEYIYDSGTLGQASVLRETIQYAGTISALSDYKLATVKTAVAAPALANDPANRKSWAVYDAAGRLAYSINAIGAVTGYSYDTLGNLTKTVQFATPRATTTLPALATMTSWQTANADTSATGDRITRNYYSARNDLRYTVDAENYVTRIDYDAEGRATANVRWDTAITAAITDSTTIGSIAGYATGASTTTSATYDNDGRVDTTTDGENVVTRYFYNHNGTLDSIYRADNYATDKVQTKFDYDNAGRKTAQYDAYGTTEQIKTSSTYDGLGNALTSTDPNLATTTYDHDHLGRVITRTDALTTGAVHYQYNGFGEAVKVTDARGNVSYNYYNNDGTLAYTIAPLGEVTEYRYDAFGELTDTIRYATRISLTGLTGGAASSIAGAVTALANSALDSKTHLAFYADGTVSAKTDALNAVTNFGYDAFGDVTSEIDPLDTGTTIQTTRTYDRRGLLKSQIVDSATGGKAITTNYNLYDAFGRLLKLTDPANYATTKTYDRNGRVLSSTDALTHTTNYSYDKRGNLVAVQAPPPNTGDPRPVTRYAYDKLDRLVYTVDALGDVTQNTYDNDGHVIVSRSYATPISLSGLPTVVSLSAIATLVGAGTSADEITHSVYDADGQLRYSIDARNFLTEYDYDVAGNAIRSVAYSAAVTLSTYTIASVQAQITAMSPAAIAASPITRNVYNGDGQRSYTIDAQNYVTAYTYDTQGNVVKQQRVAAPYTPTGDPTDAQMATWLTTNGNATNDRITRAIYDQNGQLRFSVDAETYVTQYTYNANGSVLSTIRHADRFDGHTTGSSTFTAFANGTTLAQAISYVAATPTAPAATTQFIYDTAGRLTETVDPMDVHTVMVLNQLGQATTTTVASGTADASITTQAYDALGRVTSTTRAFGQSEVTTTSYRYDALSRVTDKLDGNGNAAIAALIGTPTQTQIDAVWTAYATHYGYDANGNVLTTSVPLDATHPNALTTNSYDAFGNLVKVVDPRNNVSYFYYDVLNRLTLQVDAEKYATGTSYTFTGQVDTITRYAARVTWTGTPGPTNAPNITSDSTKDSKSSFIYDKLDRVKSTVQVTDTNPANNITESYSYNAFGDRESVINKLGGLTTNSFDKRGLLTSEVIQVTAAGGTVTNTYAYDARGNRIKMVEAGTRTTGYTYDKLDRLQTTKHQAVTVTAGDLSSTTTGYVPTDILSYDLRGNVIRSITGADPSGVGGSTTWYYYDDADRRVASVDALGILSTWSYDTNGNVLSATVYGTALATMPTTGGGIQPAAVNPSDCRTTTYAYDRNNRLKTTSGAAITTGEFVSGAYATATTAPVATNTYDAAGNLVAQTDARGNTIYSWYNALGQMTAQVDRENYLTVYFTRNADNTITYGRDANGNVVNETRYAMKIDSAAHGVTTATSVATLVSWIVPDNASDRTTTFAYDLAARRLTEKRLQVVTLTNTSGTPTTSLQDSQIVYTYNQLGEVLTKAEANGDTTTYAYDKIGRTLTEKDPGYNNQNGLAVARLTTYTYDGLNNVLTSTVSDALGNSGGEQHTLTYVYDAAGRLASTTLTSTADSSSFAHSYAYDKAGRTVSDSYVRTPASGTAFNEAVNYRYDAAGRLIYQTVAHKAIGASTWIFDADSNQLRYNAYGNVTAKGKNGQWQETYDYDANGHVWRSNAGDGSARLYLYDKNGNATLTIASSGSVDFSAFTLGAALNLFTNTNAWAAGSHAVAGAVVTIDVFDNRNQNVATREPFREINPNASNPSIYDMDTILHQHSYNAFGEVASETDARANVTNYTYNSMGKIIKRESPTVNFTDNTGLIHTTDRPTENDYYDISGRLLAVTDANAHTNRRALLAGTGHGTDAALVTSDVHADTFSAQTSYDVFGNARVLTDELGHAESRTYDSRGNVLTVAHRGGLLTDTYAYDELGQRTQHWNNQFNPSTVTIKDLTEYDGQGRIVSQVIASGSSEAVTIRYAYAWVPNGGAGYWTKETTNSAGLVATENQDIFGHVLARTDFGQHVTAYTYDKAARLITTIEGGETLTNSWYNSGKLAGTTDAGGISTLSSSYAYDLDGNRTRENRTGTLLTHGPLWVTSSVSVTHQAATITYDALGRMTSYTDSGTTGSNKAITTYQYDAVGNAMHIVTTYANVAYPQYGDSGTDTWYAYDSMNRMVIVAGTFSGTAGAGSVVQGLSGTAITYDPAGRRANSTRGATLEAQVEVFVFNDVEPGEHLPTFPEPGVNGDYQIQIRYYNGDKRDEYIYTDDGYLKTVSNVDEGWTDESPAQDGSQIVRDGVMGSAVVRASYDRDAMGRTTAYREYSADGLTCVYSRTAIYNNRGEVTTDTVSHLDSGNVNNVAITTYDYRAEASPGSWTGAYLGGAVAHQHTTSTHGSGSPAQSDTKNGYVWYDGASLSSIDYKPDASQSTTWTTANHYDGHGRLAWSDIADGRLHHVDFLNDESGHVLERMEKSSAPKDPQAWHYFVDGVQIGTINTDGMVANNYEDAIHQRLWTQGTGPFQYGTNGPVETANFDHSYDPILPGSGGWGDSAYVASGGESLQAVAQTVWGDASLWYMLADANGLSAGVTLAAGQRLVVPGKVTNLHNNASTFQPYDPNSAIGNLSPTSPQPAAKHSCGFLGQLLVAIVSIAVTMILTPVLGPLAPIAGDLAGQITGNVLGVQHGFDWKQVGRTAVHTIYGGGLIGDAEAQGISIALGLQKKFDFGELAASGVMSLLSPGGGGLQFHDAASAAANFGERLAVNTANGLINASIRSLVNGTDFGDTLMAALPSILAQTAAGYAADELSRNAPSKASASDKNQATGSIHTHPNGAAVSNGSDAQPGAVDTSGDIVVTATRRRGQGSTPIEVVGAFGPGVRWVSGAMPAYALAAGGFFNEDGTSASPAPMKQVINISTQKTIMTSDGVGSTPESGPFLVWVDSGHTKVRDGTEADRLSSLDPDRYNLFAEAIKNNAGQHSPYLYANNQATGGSSVAAPEAESGGWLDWAWSWDWLSVSFNREWVAQPGFDAAIRAKLDGEDSMGQAAAKRRGYYAAATGGLGNMVFGSGEATVAFTATAVAPPAILMTERSSSPYIVGGGRSGFVSSPWWGIAAEGAIAAKVGAPLAANGRIGSRLIYDEPIGPQLPAAGGAPFGQVYNGGAYGRLSAQAGVIERHHAPPNSLHFTTEYSGPAIQMDYADHLLTSSHTRAGLDGKLYRAEIQGLIDSGNMRGVMAREVWDVRRAAVQGGGSATKYNAATREMLDYTYDKGWISK